MAISAEAIDTLKSQLSASAEIVTPESEKYADSLKRWSAAAEKPAGAVVYPTSAEDVSQIVLFTSKNSIELAVVGGGHGTSGASSTDGGIVIDLSKMRKVTVDVEAKAVTAEGGALWKDVDDEAEKYQLAAVGGTVNHTGIGGLTLGGGYGYLSSAHGMVIDNLISIEIVLADGSITTVSSSQNPDLFWALKGAGIGFGVATSFTYKAHDQKNSVWGGVLIFPKPALGAIIEMGNKVVQDPTPGKLMLAGFAAPPPAGQPIVMAVVWYNGSEEEAKAYYKPLLDLEPLVNATQVMPYSSSNGMMNEAMFHGLRRTTKGSAFLAPLDLKFAESLWDDYVAFLENGPDVGPSVLAFEFIPYKRILEVPQTATAFANRGAYGNILFQPGWTDPSNDKLCREWTRTMSTKTKKELEKRKVDENTDKTTNESVGEYGNYDALGASGKTVFGVNFPRLAELKKRYDPHNVFSKGPSLLE